jgi:hypothetical protein
MSFSSIKIKRIAAFFSLSLFLLIGCRSSQPSASNSIVVGMPRRDVILLRGTPDRTLIQDNQEIFVYRLHQSLNEPYAPDVPYWVVMEQGKVVRHGRSEDMKKQMADPDATQARISL